MAGGGVLEVEVEPVRERRHLGELVVREFLDVRGQPLRVHLTPGRAYRATKKFATRVN